MTLTDIGSAYYADNYIDYERQSSPEKLEFYMNLLRRWAPAGASLFELGVGQGHFLERAAAEYQCAGCEINRFGLKKTQERAPNATLYLGSYETLSQKNPPQVLVSWDVLEHLPDLNAGLSSIYSNLPQGGILIAVVPVYDGPLGWLVRFLDKDPTHVSKLGRREWVRILKECGFDVVEYGGILRKLIGKKYIHLTRPQLLLKGTGSAIYFVAKK